LVSFVTAENCPSDTAVKSFRDDALWFPDIPENHLLMNESSFAFAGKIKPSSKFKPLCYAVFRYSTNHRSLTKISLHWLSGFIGKIAFHYSIGDVIEMGLVNDVCYKYDRVSSFDIDGAGGETIEDIKIGRPETKKERRKLYPNGGMSCSFEVGAHFLRQKTVLIYAIHALLSRLN
jgi:hypothetical protein